MTAVPDLHTCFKTLIASPSISSLDPSQDQANDQLIQHLHHWLTDLGFRCEVKQVISSRGKQNLLASIVPPDSRGDYYSVATQIPYRLINSAGTVTRLP